MDVFSYHELVTSEFILDELSRKLGDQFKFPAEDTDEVAAFLRRASIVVVPADLPLDVCRDPEDIPVLGTALAGQCSLLISVDRDLLDLGRLREIPIIRPAEYWQRAAMLEP